MKECMCEYIEPLFLAVTSLRLLLVIFHCSAAVTGEVLSVEHSMRRTPEG